MSRSAHSKSLFKIKELPRCSRCKVEFVLVLARYEQSLKPIEEWECQKCHKIVPRRLLKEEEPSEFDKFLAAKCKELDLQHETDRRRDRERAFRNNFKSKP